MSVPTDPFLWAHGLSDHIFDIATGLRPSSVRDQITRARLLIRRAWESGIIQPRSLIVISGAGIAGAICSLEATKNYGVRVLLIEKEPFPFLLQRRCVTRTVDPNLYDWPAEQWREIRYPSQPGDHVDFKIQAYEEPRVIARRWTAFLNSVAATDDLLEIRYRSKITKVTPERNANNEHAVTLDDGRTVNARMVVFAEGPGEERDTMPSTRGPQFHGYRFWDTDPFSNAPLTAKRVLIAGSGDGALQDFLRLLLKPGTSLRRLLAKCQLPNEYLASIQACGQHNVAAFLWCADRRHEHENDLFVHRHHTAVIEALFASRAKKDILRAVRENLRKEIPEVVLAHACEHFTHGYPVNRFLALLVARAVRELGIKQVQLCPNTFVTAIDCEHETFSYKPGDERRLRLRKHCYAQKHQVSFGKGQCFEKPPEHSRRDRQESFDAIILRLGVKEEVSTDYPRDRGEKPLRQLLPTHLAHQT
jgi:hypothetical protein